MKRILPQSALVKKIKCPICGSDMEISNGASLVCNGARRHCYDFSSGGYVNMMPPKGSGGGDSKAAVAARKSFLSLEYYRPAAEELTRTLKKYLPKDATVIDAG